MRSISTFSNLTWLNKSRPIRYVIIMLCLQVVLLGSTYGQSYTYEKTLSTAFDNADPTAKVAVDAAGNTYVVIFGRNKLLTFNAAGQFTGYFGPPELFFTISVHIDAAGRVYVAGADSFFILDAAGTLLKKIPLAYGYGITTDAAGNIYVATNANSNVPRIKVLNSEGVLIREFGTLGDGSGQLDRPNGLAIDNQTHRLYVANAGNDRVEVFSLDGTYLSQIGYGKGSQPGQLDHASDVALDAAGNVYVSDEVNGRVQVFNPDGGLLYVLGSKGSDSNYQFMHPGGIHLDAQGRVYVTDQTNRRIQVYTKTPNVIQDFSNVTKTYGDAPFTLNARSLSSAKVRYEVVNDPVYTGQITLQENKVTILRAGLVKVRAVAGDDHIYAAATKDMIITIKGGRHAIPLKIPANLMYRDHLDLPHSTTAGFPITYTSSNTGAVTISDDKLNAVGRGTATITATWAGNDFYDAVSLIATVTVKSSIPELSETSLDFGAEDIFTSNTNYVTIVNKGDTTLTLKETSGTAAFSSPVASVSVEPGQSYMIPVVFFPVRPIPYTGMVGIRINPSPGVVNDILYIEVMGSGLSTTRPKATTSLEVYPNPTSDVVMIRGNVNPQSTVIITDHMGLAKTTLSLSMLGDNTYGVDISNLRPGLYYVNIQTTDGKFLAKQIMKN